MPTLIRCPHCGVTCQLLADPIAGQKVRCSKCKQIFPIAAGQAPVTEAEAPRRVMPTDLAAEPIPRSALPAPRLAREAADVPPPRSVKKAGGSGKSSGSLLVPLLAGAAVLAVMLLVACGGGLWLIFRTVGESKPRETLTTPNEPIGNPALKNDLAVNNEPAGGNKVNLANDKPAKGLDELKDATAYIKVTAGPLRATGSGFLIKVEGNTGYVATNDHVVNLREFLGRRGRLPAAPAEVTLVFWSGTKREHSYRAEIVGADAEADLAILKVAGVAELPKPIDIANAPKLVETLPVTVFGFPFGDALAGREGNPAITVNKASVSSIRRNASEEVIAVQLDGALNPGNSGGPVVDADGRLVGVAVATIRGAHIGLAVPNGQLTKMLQGRIGTPRVLLKNANNANAEIEVEVDVIDPLQRIQSVSVHYLRSDLVKDNPPANAAGEWPELPGAQRLALRLDGRRAVGTFVVLASDKDQAFTVQASYTDGAGRRVCMQPRSLRATAAGGPVVFLPPGVGRQPGGPPQPPITLGPSKPAAPIVYQPHVSAAKEEVRLTGSVADVAVGGGGRYLILRLAGKKKLAVFDVQQGKVAKELPLLEEVVHFAAGANQLLVVYPNSRLLHLWSLATFERQRSAPLPDMLTRDSIHQVCMGSASLGPLFVYLPREKRTLAMDPKTLQMAEVRWSHWAPHNAYGPLNMRASPDGSVLIGWGGGWAGLDIAVFNDGQQVGNHDKLPFSGGMFALPGADAQSIFFPGGIANRSFNVAKVPGLEKAYLVPAVEPGYFLALRPTRDLPLYTQDVNLPPVNEVSVYSEDRKRLFNLRDCAELNTDSKLHWEKRVHYYPKAGLLVTLGATADRLVLRPIDLVAELDKSGTDYLVVLSRPPAAKAGKSYSYKLDIRSKKGGVKVKLESGPEGLKVTPDGRVNWTIPPKFSETEAEVLVTIGDASGQEVAHTFKIALEQR